MVNCAVAFATPAVITARSTSDWYCAWYVRVFAPTTSRATADGVPSFIWLPLLSLILTATTLAASALSSKANNEASDVDNLPLKVTEACRENCDGQFNIIEN